MKVSLGLDRIESIEFFAGKKRIGLITNYSGVDSALKDNIEIFTKRGLDIKKVFAPEHGLYGIADGEAFADIKHPIYGFPVISLYGDKKKPSPEDLEDIDILIFDIQDVGLRYYTFIYTLAYAMKAAEENEVTFIVLDRPNPLAGQLVKGNRIPNEFSSFVGDFRLPIRYGLTIGELAKYYKKFFKLDLDLKVIEMENYSRDTYYPDTGLFWNLPSPAIPTFESTVCYSGGCFIEGTNISEGRGTARAFQIYGAPWIDFEKIYIRLSGRKFEGIEFRKRAFVPFSSKYKDQVCFGIEFFPLKKDSDFIPQILFFMRSVFQEHPDKFEYVKYADVERIEYLTGDKRVRDYLSGKMELDELLLPWDIESKEFTGETEEIRIYK